MINEINSATAYPQQTFTTRQDASESTSEQVQTTATNTEVTANELAASDSYSNQQQDNSTSYNDDLGQSYHDLINELNKQLDESDMERQFQYDDELDRPIFKLVDKTTNEVIKEFPTEEMLNIIRSTREMLGIITDEVT